MLSPPPSTNSMHEGIGTRVQDLAAVQNTYGEAGTPHNIMADTSQLSLSLAGKHGRAGEGERKGRGRGGGYSQLHEDHVR